MNPQVASIALSLAAALMVSVHVSALGEIQHIGKFKSGCENLEISKTIREISSEEMYEINQDFAKTMVTILKQLTRDIERAYPCKLDQIQMLSFRINYTKSRISIMFRTIIYLPGDLEDVVHIHAQSTPSAGTKFVALSNQVPMGDPLPEFVVDNKKSCPRVMKRPRWHEPIDTELDDVIPD